MTPLTFFEWKRKFWGQFQNYYLVTRVDKILGDSGGVYFTFYLRKLLYVFFSFQSFRRILRKLPFSNKFLQKSLY